MPPREPPLRGPIELTIEDLHEDGPGVARHEGRTVLVWGALPGERVLADIRKRAKGIRYAVVKEVLEPSPGRIEPCDAHYLSCSPWQILAPAKEGAWKISLARRVFEREAGYAIPPSVGLVEGTRQFGYRNKMEFSFTSDAALALSLAFFTRLSRRKMAIDGCALAKGEINAAAEWVLKVLRERSIPEPALKSLVVRANGRGETLAGLFVKDAGLTIDADMFMGGPLSGLSIYYSKPESPAPIPTGLLSHAGIDTLSERLGDPGVTLSTGLLNFFQVNVEVFEAALADIGPFVRGEEVVEYYAGVGAIGIGVSPGHAPARALLLESDSDGVRHARRNIMINGLEGGYEAVETPAERMRDEIAPERVVVFDPPRAGLHPKLLRRAVEVRPRRIVYLSCNIKSQARDLRELLPFYDVAFHGLYNFFPRTPHIESLMVLEISGKQRG